MFGRAIQNCISKCSAKDPIITGMHYGKTDLALCLVHETQCPDLLQRLALLL